MSRTILFIFCLVIKAHGNTALLINDAFPAIKMRYRIENKRLLKRLGVSLNTIRV
jgi:hypothetical protein